MNYECKFNGFVECRSMNRCEKCGWNPKVKNRRLEKIEEKLFLRKKGKK